MRLAFCLFVGAGLALVGLVALLSHPLRGAGAASAITEVLPAAADQASFRRLDAKAAIVRRLLDGELTAPDAAAWFRYLDETLGPEGMALPDGQDAHLSESELYNRQVVRWALQEAEARGTPSSQVAAIGRRLEAEFRADARTEGEQGA